MVSNSNAPKNWTKILITEKLVVFFYLRKKWFSDAVIGINGQPSAKANWDRLPVPTIPCCRHPLKWKWSYKLAVLMYFLPSFWILDLMTFSSMRRKLQIRHRKENEVVQFLEDNCLGPALSEGGSLQHLGGWCHLPLFRPRLLPQQQHHPDPSWKGCRRYGSLHGLRYSMSLSLSWSPAPLSDRIIEGESLCHIRKKDESCHLFWSFVFFSFEIRDIYEVIFWTFWSKSIGDMIMSWI